MASFGDAEQRTHDLPSLPDKSKASDPNRSAHPEFKSVEATRPDWHEDSKLTLTKTKNPDWKYGDGASDGGESLRRKHVEIDPYEVGRPSIFNYKLLISGIIPRPIGFVSTRSEDGMRFDTLPSGAFSSVRSSLSFSPRRIRKLYQPRALFLHQRCLP